MNDPNGMVYLDGEYHLFYQHYPDSTVWGPMNWGHAVSTDLVSWTLLPIALYPDSLGYIFSGSAVVDRHNTAGLQTGDTPALVAIFTLHDATRADQIDHQTQGIAYSNDKGRSWTMYEGNPVLPNPGIRDFRDPKVRWHDESNQWVMTLAAFDRIHLYGSPDLKSWRYLSAFGVEEGNHGGVWECPDLFPLATPDGGTRWVLLLSINAGAPNHGSGTQYFIGDFDGTTFTNTNPPETELWIDWGRDNYAGVTWSDVPETDGRRLFLGWMSNWDYAQVVPTERWRSAMTLPRTLTLAETETGLQLISAPVKELEKLRGTPLTLGTTPIDSLVTLDGLADPTQFELILNLDLAAGTGDRFGLTLSNEQGAVYRFGYDRANGRLFSDRTNAGHVNFEDSFATGLHIAPYRAPGPQMRLHFFVDESSIEVFVDSGRVVMTELFFPEDAFDDVRLFSENGTTTVTRAEYYPLRSIWN